MVSEVEDVLVDVGLVVAVVEGLAEILQIMETHTAAAITMGFLEDTDNLKKVIWTSHLISAEDMVVLVVGLLAVVVAVVLAMEKPLMVNALAGYMNAIVGRAVG